PPAAPPCACPSAAAFCCTEPARCICTMSDLPTDAVVVAVVDDPLDAASGLRLVFMGLRDVIRRSAPPRSSPVDPPADRSVTRASSRRGYPPCERGAARL